MAVDRKKILELYDFGEGLSIRQISEVLGNSRNTITKVIKDAAETGITKEKLGGLDKGQLAELLAPKKPESSYARPDCEYIHSEKDGNPHVSLKLLWSEYVQSCAQQKTMPYQYAQFCTIYNEWAKKASVTVRMTHKPAYVAEVDWAGMKSEVSCRVTGEVTKAHYFVCVLPYSPYLYCEAFPDEKEQSWISGHIHAFRAFRGAPKLIICDNLRTGVTKADRYEPTINDTYARMAEHYNTTIVPARAYHPKGKPTGERFVRTVETWVIAALRHHSFFSFEELNDAIAERVSELNSQLAPAKERPRCDIFFEEEQPLLSPLPREDYQITELKSATLQQDAHFQFEKMRYSAPYTLIGKRLDLLVSSTTVAVYDAGKHIHTHHRLVGRIGQYSTVEEHMPEHLREGNLLWSAAGFRRWAKSAGPSVATVVEAILASRPIVEQAYRSCRGLMSLSKKRGSHLLEEACSRALAHTKTPSYTQIRNILQTMEDEPLFFTDTSELCNGAIGDEGFLRDPSDYDHMEGGEL